MSTSRCRPIRRLVLAASLIGVALTGPFAGSPALATSSSAQDTTTLLTIQPGPGLDEGVTSLSEIEFDSAMSDEAARAWVEETFGIATFHEDGLEMTATLIAAPDVEIVPLPIYPEDYVEDEVNPSDLTEDQDDGGGAYKKIYCDKYYKVRDSNGRYTIQRQCGGTTAPWSWQMSSELQSVCVSNVAETGMKWTKNGNNMPMGASHLVPCNYLFHGTYNPVGKGDKVSYVDTFTFRHDIGPGGTAKVTITGNLWFKGPLP